MINFSFPHRLFCIDKLARYGRPELVFTALPSESEWVRALQLNITWEQIRPPIDFDAPDDIPDNVVQYFMDFQHRLSFNTDSLLSIQVTKASGLLIRSVIDMLRQQQAGTHHVQKVCQQLLAKLHHRHGDSVIRFLDTAGQRAPVSRVHVPVVTVDAVPSRTVSGRSQRRLCFVRVDAAPVQERESSKDCAESAIVDRNTRQLIHHGPGVPDDEGASANFGHQCPNNFLYFRSRTWKGSIS